MIERNIIKEKIREFQVEEYIKINLRGVGHSSTKVRRTPLGEKVVISASRPGLVVGRKGQNIKKLTKTLKKGFGLENPEIEINEIKEIYLDPAVVSEMIANSLERFGTQRFKGVGHKTMSEVMRAGALGIEILISGKIPGSRAKRWRFATGYLKKSGQIAIADDGVQTSYSTAKLKTGVVGIQVRMMLPDIKLPDSIEIVESMADVIERQEAIKKEKALKKPTKRKAPKKRTSKKKTAKKKTTKKKSSKKVTKKDES